MQRNDASAVGGASIRILESIRLSECNLPLGRKALPEPIKSSRGTSEPEGLTSWHLRTKR